MTNELFKFLLKWHRSIYDPEVVDHLEGGGKFGCSQERTTKLRDPHPLHEGLGDSKGYAVDFGP